MKTLKILLLIIPFAISAIAQTKVPVERYLEALRNNKYKEVYTDIQRIREKSSYAKSPALDYFEAKCLCMNGSKLAAYNIYNKMLQSNHFSATERQFLDLEFATCGEVEATSSPVTSTINYKPLTLGMVPAMFRGKLGDVSDCYDYNQFVDFSRMPTPDSLQTRITNKKSKSRAFLLWNKILASKYRIDTISNQFIMVSPLNISRIQISAAVTKLQKAADFFSSYYNLSPPEQLITVFMMPDIKAMQTVSKTIHGIDLPSTNLGYSNLTDLTLIGISDISHIGTIYHELFHLMIRADVGDLPVWLDEGLACLYAVSNWQDDTLVGSYHGNWRTDVLAVGYVRDYAQRIPSIKALTSYTYDEFNGTDNNDICRASVNYALANHLLLYLQEKKNLQKLVAAYRKRSVIDLDHPTLYLDNRMILENTVAEPIDSLDKHFTEWMKKKYDMINIEYNRVETLVYTFDEIFGTHFVTLKGGLHDSDHDDLIEGFDRQIQEIEKEYRLIGSSANLEMFYRAERNKRHGLFDTFSSTDSYFKLKILYDKATELELIMRKAVFNKQ